MAALYKLLVAFVVIGAALADDVTYPCQDQCVSHRNGSLHCANSHCSEFPTEAESTIQKMYLQNNEIHDLPRLNYPQLILLNLTENDLKEIPAETFSDCQVLEKLLLRANKLNEVSEESFKGLANLELLDLAWNEITTINQDAFRRLDSITQLDLRYNRLTALTATSLSDLATLEFLHLEGNKLKEINQESFPNLRSLRMLNLAHNSIEKLGKNSFYECPQLDVVELQNNSLATIEAQAFAYAAKLQVIHLEHNKLVSLDADTFRRMGDYGGMLQSVYLDWNPLTTLPPVLFPSSVSKISMSHLHDLQLIGDDVFAQIDLVTELIIKDNPMLGAISSKAFGSELKTPVQVIMLTNNSLTSLAEDTFDWSRVSMADLRHNRWNCNCNMKWMVAQGSEVPQETLNSTQCQFPDFLRGQALSSISEDKFSCNPIYEHHRRIVRGVVICFLIAGIITTCVFVYKRRNKIFARCTKSDFQYKTVGYNNKGGSDVDLYRSKTTTSGQIAEPEMEEI